MSYILITTICYNITSKISKGVGGDTPIALIIYISVYNTDSAYSLRAYTLSNEIKKNTDSIILTSSCTRF